MTTKSPTTMQASLQTKFLILERRDDATLPNTDEKADAGAPPETTSVWVELGTQLARERDQALRLFLGDPVREIEGNYVAVSENAWRPRTVSIKPAIKIGDAS